MYLNHKWLQGFLICLTITAVSCDNEFNINGDYVEKTVVWGLLELNKDTNFIRINKSFLDENSSAFILAADPDNLYYSEDELEVYLEEWKADILQKHITAQYVDGDTIGIEKEGGIFANSTNILYRIAVPLDTFALYKLFIVNNHTHDTITSHANLVQDFNAYYPTKTGAYLNYNDTAKITYICDAAVNGKLYELWMKFYYWEKITGTFDSVLKKIEWQIFSNKIADNIDGMGSISYSIERYSLFNFIASSISHDENVMRRFSHMDFHWYAGGIEMYDQYLNMIANLGINEQYISPEFTNVNGGLGVFSSRIEHVVPDVYLSDATVDTLACGNLTSDLRFISSPANLFYPGCEF